MSLGDDIIKSLKDFEKGNFKCSTVEFVATPTRRFSICCEATVVIAVRNGQRVGYVCRECGRILEKIK